MLHEHADNSGAMIRAEGRKDVTFPRTIRIENFMPPNRCTTILKVESNGGIHSTFPKRSDRGIPYRYLGQSSWTLIAQFNLVCSSGISTTFKSRLHLYFYVSRSLRVSLYPFSHNDDGFGESVYRKHLHRKSIQ
jgi:hypothetical protein